MHVSSVLKAIALLVTAGIASAAGADETVIQTSTMLAEPVLETEPVVTETAFIFNTLLFLVMGFVVMFMAAGFAMLEAGMVRSSSVASIATKNVVLYSASGLMFYLTGYNLMYDGVDGGWIGSLAMWAADDSAIDIGDYSAGYAASSDWFFQMVFVATAASIVSGTIAERVKMVSFILFVAVLTGCIYPIVGAWHWGGGWLADKGFSDFAGSTIVHSTGGWAALVGVLLIGARKGRFTVSGKSIPMPASNIPLVTLGTFILWFGWFGFNGGSQLALGSAADAVSISNIVVNTNIAAAAGVIAVFIANKLMYKKIDPTMVMNGALAGLVSITAEPLTPMVYEAAIIGAIGGIVVVFTVPLLEKCKIDDVVGAIPVHLICGIWGTLAVPITNDETSFLVQFIGVVSVGAFVLTTSFIAWMVIKILFKLRISEEEEELGMDISEMGIDAYPDFVRSAR